MENHWFFLPIMNERSLARCRHRRGFMHYEGLT